MADNAGSITTILCCERGVNPAINIQSRYIYAGNLSVHASGADLSLILPFASFSLSVPIFISVIPGSTAW
jgi:hypothetical protein